MLDLRKVYHYYEKARALEEINLTVEQGSLDAVIGPNGAGKTTLMKILAGVQGHDSGEILVDGKPIQLDCVPHFSWIDS